jgi:ParB/RepB/Spo0J family partition protein
MTTAAPSKPKPTALPGPEPIFVGVVAIADIAVGPQTRKSFPPSKIKELAESIKARTMMNPVTLRPDTAKGKYVLISGERRLRALEHLGRKDVEARVFDIDADTAALWQVDENLHREELTAFEEARGFKVLMDAGKRTAEELGSIVKKDAAYVARAVRLLELPKEIVAEIEDDRLTPAHGHQLLRVPEDKRLEVWRSWKIQYGDCGNAKSLRDHVENTVGRSLDAAEFPKNKPYAGQVACSACPANSGNQGQLFDGATKGKCLGPKKCFDSKVNQHEQDQLDELKKSYPAAADVVRVNGHIYCGVRVGDEGWIAREIFNKRIPKGKFMLVLCRPTGEVWIAQPLTPAETKAKQQVKPQTELSATPEEVAAAQERERKFDALIHAAVQKATPKQISAAFASQLKSGMYAAILKQAKVRATDTLRALFVIGVHNGDWARDELATLLKVKAPK